MFTAKKRKTVLYHHENHSDCTWQNYSRNTHIKYFLVEVKMDIGNIVMNLE